MDRLSIEEIDKLREEWQFHSSTEARDICILAKQLTDAMRENERLYKALALAGAPLEVLVLSTAYQNHHHDVQIAIVEGVEAVRQALSNKESEHG